MVRIKLSDHVGEFLHLNADCVPVRGATRSAICDLTRGDIVLFPTCYFGLIEQLDGYKINEALASGSDSGTDILRFIDFLDEHEFLSIVEDVASFPAIEAVWRMPSHIQNAVIDVDRTLHDFESILVELAEVGCQFVQIRSFSDELNIEAAHHIVTTACHKSFESVELVLRFSASVSDADYVELITRHAILSSLTIHSAPMDRDLRVSYGPEDLTHPMVKSIRFRAQAIKSELQCGIIGIGQFTVPAVPTFLEAKRYNTCLNGKIAIDSAGRIKNCPSMAKSFGTFADTHLSEVVADGAFRAAWEIRKDEIKICADCEFRYVCSDCRAYITEPSDQLSKPLKCGYDPYTAQWSDWSANPLNAAAMMFYGFDSK